MNPTIPDFELPATGAQRFSSAEFRGHPYVIYFYPKDDTPGCTVEGSDFSDLVDEFRAAGYSVFGVSRDSISSHERFKAKMGYRMELLSDSDETVCRLFDVLKEKNMYGRKVWGIARSTFVMGRHNEVVKAWRGVKVPNHAQEVLDFVRSLNADTN
jgi:thioredoxin-dependent peroxiredoxin